MTGYLLDTNVVSEIRKRERCHANVRRWFATIEDDAIFLSVLVVGERHGIELIRRRDEVAGRSLGWPWSDAGASLRHISQACSRPSVQAACILKDLR